jgi:Glycosyl hydrolase family 99
MTTWLPQARIQAATRLVLPLLGALALLGAASSPTVPPTVPTEPTPSAASTASPRMDLASVPMFAYYYIWFDPSSWNRAKSDLPLLGSYSSDDETVMREHIREAKSAGIEGFIVSWKSTTVLDRRLATLMRVAREEDFKLSIIYQGLDFAREPLPATQIADDLDFFLANYASDPVFDFFGKPLVILSGTWRFSEADISAITGPRHDRLSILASEQSVDGFERVADLVDGNAYYWSSVNPDTYPNYPGKLAAMSAAVHDAGGLWISPAAAGFDARLLGHTTVVDRQGGKMLERQLDASIKSFPDAIGLISWNEFSENSYVEPSRDYGDQSLQVLARLNKTNLTPISDFDSSAPAGVDASPGVGRLLAILVVLVIAVAGVGITARRQRRIARRRRWSRR